MKRSEYLAVLSLGLIAGFFGGLMASYVAGTFAHAQQESAPNEAVPSKVIAAERFEVVDAEGNRRIVIGPDLITIDTEKDRAVLGSSGLLLSDVSSSESLDVSLSPRGLVLMENGRTRIDATMKNGEPGVRLKDRSGKIRAALGAVEVRKDEVSLPEHRPIASMVLFNEGGSAVWTAP
jgi:hypothetical protein